MTETTTVNREDTVDVSHLARWSIDQVIKVREQNGAEVIDGTLCDTQSANVVVAVFDALSPEYRNGAQRLTFERFALFAWERVS